jgi:hypothetical protein
MVISTYGDWLTAADGLDWDWIEYDTPFGRHDKQSLVILSIIRIICVLKS